MSLTTRSVHLKEMSVRKLHLSPFSCICKTIYPKSKTFPSGPKWWTGRYKQIVMQIKDGERFYNNNSIIIIFRITSVSSFPAAQILIDL